MTADEALKELLDHSRQSAVLASCGSVLGWDQRVCLPSVGGAWRGQQLAAVTELVHARGCDPRIDDWLRTCEDAGWSEGATPRAATLRRLRRDHDQMAAVPEGLAVARSQASSDAYEAWTRARADDDFATYRPHLERVLGLVRQQAAHLATHDDPYDTCLDQYEEGMTGDAFANVMAPVIPRLQELVRRRATEPATLGPGPFADDEQLAFGWQLVQAMGFDATRGRLDRTIHPFCSTMGPNDVRLTTRFRTDDLLDGLAGTLHEMGHGLYEQGLPPDEFGLPLGEAVSLGIHESQSRLWENHVGRSAAFGRWLLPRLAQHYGDRYAPIDADEYAARNSRVAPGFIRVDADEVCYDLHIWLRFELERALVRGELAVADLPAAWNQRFEELFGFAPPSDRDGCLQDVHWSAAYGYFPTYTLGNCYAAQLMSAIRRELPQLDEQLAAGDFAPLLDWLRRGVHRHGRRYEPAELCRRATGEALDASHLLRHIEARYDQH